MIQSVFILSLFFTLCSSKIIQPGEDGYIEAIAVTNQFCHVQCPKYVLQPTSTEELAQWMKHSNESFVVKGGGHSYACQSVVRDETQVLIDTSMLNVKEIVEYKNKRDQIRLGAGLRFVDISPSLSKLGYHLPHGECDSVGIAGWNLNDGVHPELQDYYFEQYDGPNWIKSITGVTYDGTIIKITSDDLNAVDNTTNVTTLSQSLLSMNGMRGIYSKSTHSSLDVFRYIGANLMVATEFEIELLPGEDQQMTMALLNFDYSRERVNELFKLIYSFSKHCGLVMVSNPIIPHIRHSKFALKCVQSDVKDIQNHFRTFDFIMIQKVASPSFSVWGDSVIGKGWVPSVRTSINSTVDSVSHDFWNRVEQIDNNQCESCLLEFSKKTPEGNMLDTFCVASPRKKEVCSRWTLNAFASDHTVINDPHLPNCVSTSENGINHLVNITDKNIQNVLNTWDSRNRVQFWGSLDFNNNLKTCDAGVTQKVQNSICVRHNINEESLQNAIREKYEKTCPYILDNTFFNTNMQCQEYYKTLPNTISVVSSTPQHSSAHTFHFPIMSIFATLYLVKI